MLSNAGQVTGSIELATAWRTQVRAPNRSLRSAGVKEGPIDAPDSLRALRKVALVPLRGRLALPQTATKLTAGVDIASRVGGEDSHRRMVHEVKKRKLWKSDAPIESQSVHS